MPQVIKPQIITTTTRDGELTIRMVIELNLNLNGQVNNVVATAVEIPTAIVLPPVESNEWMIPDFTPCVDTIDFGKYSS